jgi:hypothetical protein
MDRIRGRVPHARPERRTFQREFGERLSICEFALRQYHERPDVKGRESLFFEGDD